MSTIMRAVPYALTYALLTGHDDLWNWLLGGLFAVVVSLVLDRWRETSLTGRPVRLLWLPWLIWGASIEAIRGSWQMLLVLTGRRSWRNAGFVTCSNLAQTEHGLVVLALVQSATPGSVVAEIDRETGTLVFNAVDASDPEREGRQVKRFYDRYQKRSVP